MKVGQHKCYKLGGYINTTGKTLMFFGKGAFSALIPVMFIVIASQIAWDDEI